MHRHILDIANRERESRTVWNQPTYDNIRPMQLNRRDPRQPRTPMIIRRPRPLMIIRRPRPPIIRQNTGTQTKKNNQNPSTRSYMTQQPDHTPLLHSTIQTLIVTVTLLLIIMNQPTARPTNSIQY